MRPNPGRRAFLRNTGTLSACVLLSGVLPVCGAKALPDGAAATELAYFLKIARDGTVLLQLSKHEMGQGVAGSIAAILADELGAHWDRVRVEFMDYDNRYRYNTGGSTSILGIYDPLRKVAATARESLIEAAAARWQVPATQCFARDNEVVDRVSGNCLGFGELAPLAKPSTATPLRDFLATARPPLRPASERRLVGKALANKTNADIALGALRYASDMRVPGMLYAVVARCPAFRGKLVRYDDRAALKTVGVRKIVHVEPYMPTLDASNDNTSWCVHEGIAVLADSTWAAMRGRDALVVEWDDGVNGGHSTESYRAFMAKQDPKPAKPVHELGRREVVTDTATRIHATYEYPFAAHAPMETMNCVAHARADGSGELWIGTQNTGNIIAQATRVLDIQAGRMTVHHFPSGGSFGRRYYPDVAIEALRISRAAGHVPVQVLWTREDEMRHDHFHYRSHVSYEGGFDVKRNLVALRMLEISSGMIDGEASWNPYDIPNKHHDFISVAAQGLLQTGAWRSVTNNAWGLGQECFMDELAHHAGMDPLAFRLKHLQQPQTIRAWGSDRKTDPARLRKVLTVAAERAGWGDAPPAGRALGIAAYEYLPCNAFCAHVAEVSVSAGKLTIHRMVCAFDCGLVVNPDNVRAQIEGNMVWGLTALLKPAIAVEKGRVLNSNFHDAPVLRMSECPPIEIHLVEGGDKPGGAGEPPLPSVIPAVLNAIFAATGRRIRRLPVTAADLA